MESLDSLNQRPLSGDVWPDYIRDPARATYPAVRDCPCKFQAELGRLTCSNIDSFEELSEWLDAPKHWCHFGPDATTPADGRPAGNPETGSFGDVNSLCITHSGFSNFSMTILHRFPNVKQLVLNYNYFREGEIVPSSEGFANSILEELDLTSNNLETLSPQVLEALPRLKTIHLSDNHVSFLHENLFVTNKYLRNIYLRDNPLRCDKMEWFFKWIQSSPNVTVLERDQSNCTYYVGNDSFGSVTFENLIDRCPINCTCVKFRAGIKVICRNKGYHGFPDVLPATTSILHMENNQIASLQTLINGSNYASLRFLYLDNNSIDSINILERTDFFNSLNALHMTGNRLTKLPTHMVERMLSVFLDEVKLGNNPWNCECKAVAPFHDLMIKYYKKFTDIKAIRCDSSGRFHPNQPIHKLSKPDFCAPGLNNIHPLDVMNVCMVIVIMLIVCKVMYDYRRLKQTGQLPVGPFQCYQYQKHTKCALTI